MPVSLVIPGRNASRTVRQCLNAVLPLLRDDGLEEIVFVDDGSTDGTAEIVGQFPVRCIPGEGKGPGAARNLGWRAARSPIIWFIDADCVAEPDALERLLPHLDDLKVGGVGGSYGNMEEDSVLACLIHEEIVERHRRMPDRVNYLATFNVIYRRSILEQLGGFNERYITAEDADLAWRVLEAGYELAFDINSRVKHFHPIVWRAYLRTQRKHGHWRARLYLIHREHAAGDSYSGIVDHIQPPLAMLVLASMPLLWFPLTRWAPPLLVALLVVAQAPMTWRLVRRTRQVRYVCFGAMGFVRAFWRGVGLVTGTLATLRPERRMHR